VTRVRALIHIWIRKGFGVSGPTDATLLMYDELTEHPVDDSTYPWGKAIRLSAEDATRNAETYTFYAWLARCADKGYRLKMDGQDDEAKLETIEKGDVLYDENLERVGGEQEVPS
jgi:hypothetical protein